MKTAKISVSGVLVLSQSMGFVQTTEFDDSATLSDGKNETGLPPAGHIVHDSKCNLFFICIYLSSNS